MAEPVVILRRFLLWTIICCVSAAPSFMFARNEFHPGAMVLGVCLFILGYTALTSTAGFERFHRRPFVRRTLYIGYGLRLTISVLIPVGMGADVVPGILSIAVVREILKMDAETFLGTLLTTCIQGTLLNLILLVFMAIVQGIQRLFCKPPEEPQGFQVVMAMPVQAIEPVMPVATAAAGPVGEAR